MSLTGTVAKWNTSKGRGFIKPAGEEQKDVYAHYSAIVGGSRLQEGAEVNFDIDTSEPKGKKEKDMREAGKQAAINITGAGVIASSLGGQMGTVCEWSPALGYGFILGTDGSKVYVHESAFDGARLQVGKAVTYDAEGVGHKSGRGVAVNVGGSAVQQQGSTRGIVKSWIASKGYGFAEANGQEIFVHSSAIGNGWLAQGKEIFFEVEEKQVEGEDAPKLSAVGVTGPGVRDGSSMGGKGAGGMGGVQMVQFAKGGKGRKAGMVAMGGKGQRGGDDKRRDTDGKMYSKKQFIEQYGGTTEWDARETRMSPLNGKMYTKEQFKVSCPVCACTEFTDYRTTQHANCIEAAVSSGCWMSQLKLAPRHC